MCAVRLRRGETGRAVPPSGSSGVRDPGRYRSTGSATCAGVASRYSAGKVGSASRAGFFMSVMILSENWEQRFSARCPYYHGTRWAIVCEMPEP